MKLYRLPVGTALIFLLIGAGNNAEAIAPEGIPNRAIVTESGPLKGLVSADINKFLGIPYATPPLGERRWTPPRPHGRWHGVFQATQLGNPCPQRNFFGTIFGDEDCLSLNVYTPGLKKHQNNHHGLPVMVWIHGGSLVEGSGGLYDPTPLVKKGGVIVVTINYRLGVLGSSPIPRWMPRAIAMPIMGSWTSNWPSSGYDGTSPPLAVTPGE